MELAVESLAGAQAAAAGGADRIELAPELAAGGVTPSDDLTSTVVEQVDIPLFAMIRPRAGDFVYSAREVDDMCITIERLRAIGVQGVVTGALTNQHTVDLSATVALVAAASGLPVTFHRAFDRATNLSTALEQLIDLGVSRVLTSAGAATALEGSAKLRAMVEQSCGRIAILAGGGIRESNVRDVISRGGVTEVHTRLTESGEALTAARVQTFRAIVDQAAPRPTGPAAPL